MTPPATDISLRHRAENPLLMVGVILTLSVIGGGLYLLIEETMQTTEIITVLTAIAGPLTIWLRHYYHHWQSIGNGVRITEHQLPEIHTIYIDVAEKMGFGQGENQRPLPDLYLVGNGASMGGHTSRCRVFNSGLELHSDFAEMVYTVGDQQTVRYLLAHQLGHILADHTRPLRSTINAVMLGAQLNRPLATAEEYSADRAVARFVPEAIEGAVALYSDKNIRSQVNIGNYYSDAAQINTNIWLRIANFGSTHPLGVKRMLAFAEMQKKGWDVHGELF